jgi:serine/threonine-protein kinase
MVFKGENLKNALKSERVLALAMALVFVALSYRHIYPLEGIEGYIYGFQMRLAEKGAWETPNIALIDIDDKSLERFGPWPWPPCLIAEMIDVLRKNGSKLIGILLPFPKRAPELGFEELKQFREEIDADSISTKNASLTAWILEQLEYMEQRREGDRKLIESVKASGHVVLACFGQLGVADEREIVIPSARPILTREILTSQEIFPALKETLHFRRLTVPYTELAEAALGLGYVDTGGENGRTVQSYPAYFHAAGSFFPSFPMRLAMAYFDRQPGQCVATGRSIRLKDFAVPLDHGRMLIRFKSPSRIFSRYSYADILQAESVRSLLEDKIAIIGFNNRDARRFKTPITTNFTAGELTAQILDNILHREFISRPPMMPHFEASTILLMGGLASFLPCLKGRGRRLLFVTALLFFILLGGALLIAFAGLRFKCTYVGACLVSIYFLLCVSGVLWGEHKEAALQAGESGGFAFQDLAFLDLAFEKFKELPLDSAVRDLVYHLGSEYERRHESLKALSVYEYIHTGNGFRDVHERIIRLKGSSNELASDAFAGLTHSDPSFKTLLARGSRVGLYEIIEPLGRGSMGLVYKALDPKINRLVAIKTIRFSDEFDRDIIQAIQERFFREAEMAGKLSHPSIVAIYDVGEDHELTYMVMEFLDGEDLEKYTRRGNLLPARKVLDIVAAVAGALNFAHQKKVIHADIKPANIMLLKEGRVKVTDFGISKAISSWRTKTGLVLGTHKYMSPEQIMGKRIDGRSDIFSLGVVFFQLLTGELPFHGKNLSKLLYQITQAKHPPLRDFDPKFPKACEQIIDRTLEKNPDDRFGTPGEMAKYLRLLAARMDRVTEKAR